VHLTLVVQADYNMQSKTHVVLATLRRSPEELSSHHPKMFKVDDHLGVAVSGLNSDGRSLSRYMRTETLNHRFVSSQLFLSLTNHANNIKCLLSTVIPQHILHGLRCIHLYTASSD